MCDGRNHTLKEVFQAHKSTHIDVVKWCVDCGAVVVDAVVDGRDIPGFTKPMLFPKSTRCYQDHKHEYE